MYEIKIVEKRDVVKTVRPEYQKVGEKVEDGKVVSEYGVPAPYDKDVTINREVYCQIVEEIDMNAVIKAINGIDG